MLFRSAPSHVDLFDYEPKLRQWHGRQIPDEVVGGKRFSTMTGNLEPVRFVSGTLWVRPAASVWAQELPFLVPRLLEGFARLLPDGPVAIHLAALDSATEREHHVGVTVIGSTRAVFPRSAAEFTHGDEADIRHLVAQILVERRDGFRQLLGRPNRRQELELTKKRLRREKSAARKEHRCC